MTECGHCRDCKWWVLADESFLDDDYNGDAHQCSHVHHSSSGEGREGEKARTACEDPYCGTALLTDPDFGCVQFELMEAK